MKKKLKLLSIIIMTLLLVGIPTLFAQNADVDADDAGGSGQGVDNSCTTSLGSNKICRSGTNKFNFYVSLTNPATAANGIIIKSNASIAEINAYHDSIVASKQSVCRFIESTFGISCTQLEEDCSGFQDKIYFAVEAPFYYQKRHVRGVTVKELAQRCTNGTYNCAGANASAISNYFRTTNSKAGVYSATGGPTGSWGDIANLSSGWGVAAISLRTYGIECKDIAGCRKGYEVRIAGQGPTCQDDNRNHESTISEYTVAKCNGSAGKYGRVSGMMGTYCKLYCLESAKESFPGGISTGIPLGTSLVWPTSSKNYQYHNQWGNIYPLSFYGKRVCRIGVLRNPDNEEEITPYEDYKKVKADMNELRIKHNHKTDIYPELWDVYMPKYEDSLGQAMKKLDEAEKSYKTCMDNRSMQTSKECGCKKGQRDPLTGSWSCTEYNQCMLPTCESEKKAVEDARNEAKKWDEIIKTAKAFKEAYITAQTILEDMKQCAEWSMDTGQIYNFQTNVTASYNDPEYGNAYNLEKATGTDYNCDGCSSNLTLDINPERVTEIMLKSKIDAIESRVITADAKVTYKLPDGLYNYVDKKTKKALMNPTGDYITIGYSNLPTSYDAKIGKKYELRVNVLSLGHNGNLTQNAQQPAYVCHYSLTTGGNKCECPEGTKHAGQDLTCKIISESRTDYYYTCADGQTLWCDSDITFEEQCDDQRFCPNDSTIDLSACIVAGHSYDYCVERLCNDKSGDDNNYHCPKGTYNDGMDIKPCVFANISMGLEKAIKFCQDTICPYKGGVHIIYRPISLSNPFPGKLAIGDTIDFSLKKVKGRHPGTNWNSKTLVQNEIIYNRKTEADTVYEKEPLYTFILNGTTIKNIRAYNEKQEKSGGYADYTLDCKKNGIACLSNEFLRYSDSGLVSGKCYKASGNSFYTCAQD